MTARHDELDDYNLHQFNDNLRSNYRRADLLGLYYNELLNTDWDFLLQLTDINTACADFYDRLYSIFDHL